MTIDTNYYLKCDLNERGWTEHLINIFYGRPDKLKHRRGFKNNLCLYKKDDVFEIEESDAFKRGFEHSVRTRAERAIHYFYVNDKFSRDDVVIVKIKTLSAFQSFAHIRIFVPDESLYSSLVSAHGFRETSNIINRIEENDKIYTKLVVDFIRDCRTNYLKELSKLMDVKKAADSCAVQFPSFEKCLQALKQSANAAISQRYQLPFEECFNGPGCDQAGIKAA